MEELFDIGEALELAKICKSTYSSAINHKNLKYNNTPLHSQKIVHGSFGRGFCRIFWNDSSLIFAFRGTREDIDWIISNLKILPVPFKDSKNKFLVHSGFQNALYFTDKTTKLISLDAIYKHITDLDLLKSRKIIITGHSLGGALALLFFTKIYFHFNDYFKNNKTRIVVFGCPAVGLKKFKEHFNKLNQETLRIINKSDLITFLPPYFYHHVGNEVGINDNEIIFRKTWGSRMKFTLRNNPKNFISNHSMTKYILSLKQLYNTHCAKSSS